MRSPRIVVNENFFEIIDSELKAYLLGFYSADGCIFKDTRSKTESLSFKINLQVEDIKIVELFRDNIAPNAKIGISKKAIYGTRVNNPQAILRFTNTTFCNNILNKGFDIRKTLVGFRLPEISDKFILDFIRGYFDGNGSIRQNLVVRKSGKDCGKTVKNIQLDFTSNNPEILSDIKSVLEKYNVVLNLVSHKKKYFQLRANSKDEVFKFYNLLYNNREFFLERKKKKFEQIQGNIEC